jgi:hypothetical protein
MSMTKKQLLEKLAELEKRIVALEGRPPVVINNHPVTERVNDPSPWGPSWPPYQPTIISAT